MLSALVPDGVGKDWGLTPGQAKHGILTGGAPRTAFAKSSGHYHSAFYQT